MVSEKKEDLAALSLENLAKLTSDSLHFYNV